MRARFLIVLLACLALLAAAAGCGAQDEAAIPAGAELVPADVPLFVAVNTDFDSGQWEQAGDLLDEFPDGAKVRAFILDELGREGVDLDDVKAAVGPQVNLVWLDAHDDESFVGMTQPDDADKLREVFHRTGEELIFRDVEGWTAFADDERYLDALVAGLDEASLADDAVFADAMARVAADALVRGYFNGPVATSAFDEDAGLDAGTLSELLPGGEVPWASFSAAAEDRGGRVEAAVGFAGDPEGYVGPSYEATLPDVVPAGALAYISFNDLEGQLSKLRDAFAGVEPEVERDLARFESEIGVSLEEDVGPLLAGEGALYVRQGAFIPEITLVLEVENEEEAMATLDDLAEGLGEPLDLGEPHETEIAGVQARQVDIEPPVALYYAAFDGRLVLTTQRAGIEDLRDEDDRLADDELFRDALEDADMPDETVGFLFVNLREAIPYMVSLIGEFIGDGGGVPDEARRNVEPLEHFVVYGTRDGDVVEVSGFLAID